MYRNGAWVRADEVADLVARQLSLASTSWSIGVLGALAEFHRDDVETWASGGVHSIVTARGALRLQLTAATRAVAYETLAAHPESWHHGVALCLPGDACTMHRRRAITELGPDRDAIRPDDRADLLFDLGLDTPYCDFYVRTRDPGQIARLRAAVGRSLFDTRHELLHEIPLLSPHRVFVSRLGRIEVYQRIGAPGGATPDGPHTHVLPKLLRCNRTHSANIALPAGWIPCVTLYPANPVRDDRGLPKPFDAAQYHAFQALLAIYGEPGSVDVKHKVRQAVRSGAAPDALGDLRARHQRVACRIALRQMLHSDGLSPLLAAWRAAFDPAARSANGDFH